MHSTHLANTSSNLTIHHGPENGADPLPDPNGFYDGDPGDPEAIASSASFTTSKELSIPLLAFSLTEVSSQNNLNY